VSIITTVDSWPLEIYRHVAKMEKLITIFVLF